MSVVLRRQFGVRRFSSLAAAVLQNGILEHDDYFRKGIKRDSKFQLPQQHSALPIQNQPSKKTLLDNIFNLHKIDPFKLVDKNLKYLSENIHELMGSDHPVLKSIAKYFFDVSGKRIRPTILLVLAQAMHFHALSTSPSPSSPAVPFAVPTPQLRLSQITEMIHTASLLHDDVIDDATTRRGIPSLNRVYGNKLAILGGDFLLARASVALARLRDPEVIEIMSTVIEHLVKGEVMQFRPKVTNTLLDNIDYYMTKSYYKTASLIAGSSRCIAILGGYDAHMQLVADEFGKNIGLAFQIIDDLLDFSGTEKNMGKATLSDISTGVITAPILYAAQEFPELRPMIDRKFNQPGDVKRAVECIKLSNSLERAHELALECGEKAIAAILQLTPSPAQSACIALVHQVLQRDR